MAYTNTMRETHLRSVVPFHALDRRLPPHVSFCWRTLHTYWRSKFADTRPPSRSDIDPVVDIPRLVANLMLLDVERESFRYRVTGSKIDEICVTKLTGRRCGEEDWADGFAAAQWRATLHLAARAQQAQLYFVRLPRGIDVNQVVLVLPLVNQENRTENVLVGSFWDGYIPPGTPALEFEPLGID